MRTERNPQYAFMLALALAAIALFFSKATVSNLPQADTPIRAQAEEDISSPSLERVMIENAAFEPQTLTVKVGTRVIWTNKDSTPNTVTTDDRKTFNFDTGTIPTLGSKSITFTKAGTYNYHCTRAKNMTGTIIVTE